MKKIYGFGIVGTGAIAAMHARAIQAIASAELIAVFNHHPEKAQEFARTHHTRAYAELEELLADPEIDVVCICTPSGAHLEPALSAITQRKHCLVEKPLEINLQRCRQLTQAARQMGVQISTIFPSRFHPSAVKIKSALAQGYFGDIVLGNAYVKWSRPEAYYQSASWRGTWALDGGGALMNQGIHAVDLLLWYLGEVDHVQAISANRKHLDIEVEDTIVAQLKFHSGALGTLECTTAAFSGSPKTIEVIGTCGRACLQEDSIVQWDFQDPAAPTDTVLDDGPTGGGQDDPMAIGMRGHQRQIEDFLNALDRHQTPQIAGEEGLQSVRLIEAIYQSARSGLPVRPDSI